MLTRSRAPWILATAQVLLAAGLLYWDHIDYERILRELGFISLTDHWSFAGGILLIIDFPTMVLMLPLVLGLPDYELPVDLVFLSVVFAVWFWIGFQFRGNVVADTSRRGVKKIACLIGCLLVAMVGLVTLKSLMVSRTAKILVVAYWADLGLLGLWRSMTRKSRINPSSRITAG